jgi:hypothetical protein
MAIQNHSFAEPCLQQLPEEIAQLAYRFHIQPGLRELTSHTQTDIEQDVFGPSAAG